MRKLILLSIFATMVLAELPQAHAATKTYRSSFKVAGTVPCGVVCAYNIDFSDTTGVAPVQACKAPFPDTASTPLNGTGAPRVKSHYDYKIKVPKDSNYWNYMTVNVYPVVDWDSFICDGSTRRELASGANSVDGDCNSTLVGEGAALIGCKETIRIRVVPGRTYIIRGYNYSDPNDCPFTITLKHV